MNLVSKACDQHRVKYRVRYVNMSIVGNMSTGYNILNNNGNWVKFGLEYSHDTNMNSFSFHKVF